MPWIYDTANYLTMEQMQNNAPLIGRALAQGGWKYESICAVLGNMQVESTLNPALWEHKTGYPPGTEWWDPNTYFPNRGLGLVQWTPWKDLTDWAFEVYGYWEGDTRIYDGDLQCKRLIYEATIDFNWNPNNPFSSPLPRTYEAFAHNTDNLSIMDLAEAFVRNYERPGSVIDGTYVSGERGALAEAWDQYFKDNHINFMTLPIWILKKLVDNQRRRY